MLFMITHGYIVGCQRWPSGRTVIILNLVRACEHWEFIQAALCKKILAALNFASFQNRSVFWFSTQHVKMPLNQLESTSCLLHGWCCGGRSGSTICSCWHSWPEKKGPKRFVHGSSSMVHGPALLFAALYIYIGRRPCPNRSGGQANARLWQTSSCRHQRTCFADNPKLIKTTAYP